MDKLVIGSQGLQSTHQSDIYGWGQISALFSKNIDWFSSAQSIKASAWGNTRELPNEVFEEDEKGRFQLMNDCTVYDKERGRRVMSQNYEYLIQRVVYPKRVQDEPLKPEKLVVFYEGDEMKSLVAFTNKYQKVWQPDGLIVKPMPINMKNCTVDVELEGWEWVATIRHKEASRGFGCDIGFDIPGIAYENIQIEKVINDSSVDVRIDRLKCWKPVMEYDEATDAMKGVLANVQTVDAKFRSGDSVIEFQSPIYKTGFYRFGGGCMSMNFEVVDGDQNVNRQFTGEIRVRLTDKVTQYLNILYPYKDRVIKSMWGNIFVRNKTISGLWGFEKIKYRMGKNEILQRREWTQVQEFEHGVTRAPVDCVLMDTSIVLLSNVKGDGLVNTYPLVAGEGAEEVRLEGIAILWAVGVNRLIYMIVRNRGVNQLCVYNGGEIVPVISAREKGGEENIVTPQERFERNGKIAGYKWRVICGTEDGRIFAYGERNGVRGGVFIWALKKGEKMENLISDGVKLKVLYKRGDARMIKELQDDVPVRDYMSEREVMTPVYLGKHSSEKEALNLEISALLPSKETSIELRVGGNQYSYWTFYVGDVGVDQTASYRIKGTLGDYQLKYVGAYDGWVSFCLEGDLPCQVWKPRYALQMRENPKVEVAYTKYHHLLYLGKIEAKWYEEKTVRFTNIHNLLNLPKLHSLQLMIRGIGTNNHTPEVFTIALSSDQRERW